QREHAAPDIIPVTAVVHELTAQRHQRLERRRAGDIFRPPDRRRDVAERQAADDGGERRFGAGRSDGDLLDAETRGGWTGEQNADRRPHRRAQIGLPAMMEHNHTRWMTTGDLIDRYLRDRRGEIDLFGRGAVAIHDEVRHQRARDRAVAAGIPPEDREIVVDPGGRRGTRHAVGHTFLQRRPVDSIMALASGGPHSPAAYGGTVASCRSAHRSRIGITQRQAASTASRRMNNVGSPAMTSSSRRSYASGEMFPNVLP